MKNWHVGMGKDGIGWVFSPFQYISYSFRHIFNFFRKNIRLKCCVKERETFIERWKLPGPKASLTDIVAEVVFTGGDHPFRLKQSLVSFLKGITCQPRSVVPSLNQK